MSDKKYKVGEQMEIGLADHTFSPWRIKGESRVNLSAAKWKEPLKWNREAEEYLRFLQDDQCGRADPIELTAADMPRPRVSLPVDLFEDWQGPIVNSRGGRLVINDGQGANGAIYSFDDGHPEDDWGCRELTMDDLRRDLFSLIDATPNLDWLLLTKRPENVRRMWCSHINTDGMPPSQLHRSNVWIGTSVENQEQAAKRIPELLKCRDLSPVLFLSMEPMLGPVDLSHFFPPTAKADCPAELLPHYNTLYSIDWIITGGESGPHARPSHPDWFRSLRDQCAAAGVPFLFKQWGEWAPADQCGGASTMAKITAIHPNGTIYGGKDILPSGEGLSVLHRVGKKAAGRLLDGREWNGFPAAI